MSTDTFDQKKMNKILIPCDFSEPAMQALKFAVDLAKESKGEILILNVVELPSLYNTSAVKAFKESFIKNEKLKAENEIRKIKEKLAKPALKLTGIVEFGGLQTTIRDVVKRINADLLVVGTHGASGLREYTVGSNTEKIVRMLDVPVIAIKRAPKAVKNIVFPVTPELDQEILTMKVKQLQSLYKATLHVLFVNTPAAFRRDSDIKPALDRFAKRFMLKNWTLNVYNDTSEEEGIINFSRVIKADLVAMRTHGRRGLAHLAAGSIAEDVVNHIECPIWTLKIK
jgi:nucleotide-binding universal stress UspA family protein